MKYKHIFRIFTLALLFCSGIIVSAQHKSLKLEYLVISIYEPPQSDILQSAGLLQPRQTDIERKLQEMRSMGIITEISASPEVQREVSSIRSAEIRSTAEVLERASDLGWRLESAFYQDLNGFPMRVFVFVRKKKKK